MINGTANSGDYVDNYRYSFNISTNNQYAMADHAFYSSSDPNAHAADFAYRLEFTHIIEFDDENQNGFYDGNENIVSITPLRELQWTPLSLHNITVPRNESQFYIETTTSAKAYYNGTTSNPSFDVEITWRVSNLQINNTAPIVIQPNSLQYDISLKNYPANPNSRLAIAQLVSTLPKEAIAFDVNTTTPVDVANQIKTNLTYGMSIGNYTQGRLEYPPTVNITNVGTINSWIDLDPTKMANSSFYNNDDWVWGSVTPSTRKSDLLFVTIPKSDEHSLSGFGFLDTDVMGAMVDESGGSSFFTFNIYILLGMLVFFYFLKQRSSSRGYVPL